MFKMVFGMNRRHSGIIAGICIVVIVFVYIFVTPYIAPWIAPPIVSADPDGDGLLNEQEKTLGTDPLNADTDNDGIDDGTEFESGTSPVDFDTDGDGIGDGEESQKGTDPKDIDSDNDGLEDGFEVSSFGTNPLLADTDLDKLSDKQEQDYGTNPLSSDTDEDGSSDYDELFVRHTDPSTPDVSLMLTIRDVETDLCAKNVVVYVDGNNKGTTTQQGTLLLNTISVGTHRVSITYTGYGSIEIGYMMVGKETSSLELTVDMPNPELLFSVSVEEWLSGILPPNEVGEATVTVGNQGNLPSEFVQNISGAIPPNEKRILDSIMRSPDVTDVEHVLQTIDPIITFDSNPYVQTLFKQSQPNIPLTSGSANWRDFINWCGTLKDTIISELHRQYEFDRTRLRKVVDAYNIVFGELSMPNDCLDLFTTNYDSVIEHYCTDGEEMVQFTCGFVRDSRSGREFWNPEQLGRWKPERNKGLGIKIYKLHGSLDWRETDGDRTERVPTEERVSRVTRRYKRNILIYPAQKNYVTEEPFRRLIRYFEVVLNQYNLCLVIGFSFRDPFINGAFIDYLTAERKRRLVVVSPNASTNVKDNLLGGNKKLEKRVTCIDKLFGEQETFGLIFESLEGKPIKPPEEEE